MSTPSPCTRQTTVLIVRSSIVLHADGKSRKRTRALKKWRSRRKIGKTNDGRRYNIAGTRLVLQKPGLFFLDFVRTRGLRTGWDEFLNRLFFSILDSNALGSTANGNNSDVNEYY